VISLLEIAQNMKEAEVDDDKIIKYKDKEGESQEMTAGAAKKQPDDHPAKQAWNKMAGDGGDGEKDSGGKLGKGDFDRDSNKAGDDEADDMDRDARFDADAEDDDFNQDITDPVGVDAIEAGEARDYIESNDLDADGIQNMWDSLQAKGYKHYDNNYRDVGKDIQKRIDYLKDGKGSDGFPMTSDVAEMKDKAKIGKLMQVFTKQHPLKKSDKKSESIKVIDGKKYKAIKESKKNPRILKEIYDRTFRSLK
jgi:hypothetical protein